MPSDQFEVYGCLAYDYDQRHLNFAFQVEFYGGSWAWPMISHISMPLAIFYRYHPPEMGWGDAVL